MWQTMTTMFLIILSMFMGVTAETGVNPTFEMGQSRYRFDLLNYNNFQFRVFCTRIEYLIKNYKVEWQIEDQLNLDMNACKSNGIRSYDNLEMNNEPPAIKVSGVLPFEFNCVENRTSTILSLRSWAATDHCSQVEKFILAYIPEWNCWEQLALDFSVCLRNTNLATSLDRDDRLLDITNKIRANVTSDINYNGNDIPYLYNGYISRRMLIFADDLLLNFFCNRVLFLHDNYDPTWQIGTQLEVDIVACWLMMVIRNNFTRTEFPVTFKSPDIKVMGNLIFNPGPAHDRTPQLLALGTDRLRKHCTQTSDLLKKYNLNWRTIDQMSDDVNVCTFHVWEPPSMPSDFSFKNLSLQINTSSTNDIINTCKIIADIIQENWRMRKNISEILSVLKICFFKMTPLVACDIIHENPIYEKDAIDLKPPIELLDWDSLRMLNSDEVYDICVQQISKIRHLFFDKRENEIMLTNLAICVNVFLDNSASHGSYLRSQYYIFYERLLSFDERIPLCENTLSTILKILFPESLIGTAYEYRRFSTSIEIKNTFKRNWENIRKNRYYFTNECNDVTKNENLCSDLSMLHNKMSVETYCELSKALLLDSDIDSDELTRKLTLLQNCFTFAICRRLNCTKTSFRNNHENKYFDKCFRTIKEIIESNWTQKNYRTKINAIIAITGCIYGKDSNPSTPRPYSTLSTYFNSSTFQTSTIKANPFLPTRIPKIGKKHSTSTTSVSTRSTYTSYTSTPVSGRASVLTTKTSFKVSATANYPRKSDPEIKPIRSTYTFYSSTPVSDRANALSTKFPVKMSTTATYSGNSDPEIKPTRPTFTSYSSTPLSDRANVLSTTTSRNSFPEIKSTNQSKPDVDFSVSKTTHSHVTTAVSHTIKDDTNESIKGISETTANYKNYNNPSPTTVSHMNTESSAASVDKHDVEKTLKEAALLTAVGLLAGLGANLASSVAVTIPGIPLGSPRSIPNSRPRRKPTKRKDADEDDISNELSDDYSEEKSKEDSEEDSEEKSEKTTTTVEPSHTTETPTTQEATTTEPPTTTEEPNSVCYLEPPFVFNYEDSRKTRKPRSPTRTERIMNENDYPIFPLGLCRLVINELNSHQIERDSFEFIELIKLCKPSGKVASIITPRILSNYLVVIIDGRSMSIVFGAKLDNAKQMKDGKNIYITIGPNGREEISLSYSDHNVFFKASEENDIIPNGKEVANMLLLLYVPSTKNHKYLLPQNDQAVVLNEAHIDMLLAHRQDCIVYGSSATKDKCSVFEKICPELKYKDNDYFLRDWESENGVFQDLSLSRCVTHIWPMDPWGFKLSPVSPGKANICPEGVRFVLSENQHLLPLKYDDVDENAPDAEQAHCSSTLPERQVREMDADLFRRGVKQKRQETMRECMEGDLQSSWLSSHLKTLQSFNNYITAKVANDGIWPDSGCRPSIKQHLQVHMSDKVNPEVCDDPRIGWWLELTPGPDASSRKIYCKICTELYKDYTSRTPSMIKMTKLMNIDGFLDTSEKARSKNTNIIYAHAKSQVHMDAVDYVRDQVVSRKNEEVQQIIRSSIPPADRITRPTEILFQQVMFDVIHSHPAFHFSDEVHFNQHVYFADVGHKYRDKNGHKIIVQSVADDYFRDLCHEINQRNPFSILLDTYKDFSGRNMIAVSLLMFYKNKIDNKFFCLLELGSDHSNVAQFATIKNFVQSSPVPIEDSFVASLAYFTADGASTNSGQYNSIKVRLEEYTGRKISFFHCSSHRLHLVFTKILKTAQFMHTSSVIKSAEKIYSFFDTRSNRRARLVEIQTRKGKKALVPHKPHPIRWASSMRQAFLRIFDIYDEIVEAIKEELKDGQAAVRVKARQMIDHMTTKDYVTWLTFLCDVMDIFASFSLLTQKKAGTLLEQVEFRTKLRDSISDLEHNSGPMMKKLNNFITCDSRSKGICDIQNFENYGATFKAIPMDGIGSNLENTKLFKNRGAYVRMMLNEVDKQFPPQYNMYTILIPRNIQIPKEIHVQFSQDQTRRFPPDFHYGENEFPMIVKDLGKTYSPALYDSWRNLIWTIVTDAEFVKIRDLEPVLFWMAMVEKPQLPWNDELKWIVRAALVIPVSSAEVERIFSSVTYMLGRYRFRTSISLLNDYLRLRSELPRPITTWQPYPHVIKFGLKGHAFSESTDTDSSSAKSTTDDTVMDVNEDEDFDCDDPDDCFWK